MLLNQIYLPKIQEYTRKYDRVCLKKSAFDSNAVSVRLRKLMEVFMTVSLFKLKNAAVILAFSSSLVSNKVLFSVSLNWSSHKIIKVFAYFGVRRPDVRSEDRRSFLAINIGLSSMALSPVARCDVLQQPSFQFIPALPPSGTWCISPCSV